MGLISRLNTAPSNMLSKAMLAGVVGGALVGVASATNAPLLSTALEVVSRASSSSEVLSLNLTNLLILLALKIAIVVFGLISGTAATGRSHGDIAMDQVDLTGGACFLLYTGGDYDKLECVARSACESPVSADKILRAAKLWKEMHDIIDIVPFNEKYIHIMDKVHEAIQHGKTEKSCEAYRW